jgi:predicted GIY-YIG superfamily endonuclease
MEYQCYLIQSCSGKRTYVGVTIDLRRRLRQHNGEIVGGAKATRADRPWKFVCHVGTFEKKNALRFEWMWKNMRPKKRRGLESRIEKLNTLLRKERWTEASPLSADMPLCITWIGHGFALESLPSHIEQKAPAGQTAANK